MMIEEQARKGFPSELLWLRGFEWGCLATAGVLHCYNARALKCRARKVGLELVKYGTSRPLGTADRIGDPAHPLVLLGSQIGRTDVGHAPCSELRGSRRCQRYGGRTGLGFNHTGGWVAPPMIAQDQDLRTGRQVDYQEDMVSGYGRVHTDEDAEERPRRDRRYE